MKRRDALLIGGAAAVALSIPPILRRRSAGFEFQPLPGFDGFRRLDRGTISGGIDIFAGLDGPAPAAPDTDACTALFRTPIWEDHRLPVAVFSDVNCPNCLALETRLTRMAENGAPLKIMYHQLPLLGPRSVWAAKITLAATKQNKAGAVHRDLMQRVLRPGRAGARDVAQRHDLSFEQLWTDATGPEIAAALDLSLGLGAALGIPGTPGTMVGRTLVIGAIPQAELEQLIALEQAEPFDVC